MIFRRLISIYWCVLSAVWCERDLFLKEDKEVWCVEDIAIRGQCIFHCVIYNLMEALVLCLQAVNVKTDQHRSRTVFKKYFTSILLMVPTLPRMQLDCWRYASHVISFLASFTRHWWVKLVELYYGSGTSGSKICDEMSKQQQQLVLYRWHRAERLPGCILFLPCCDPAIGKLQHKLRGAEDSQFLAITCSRQLHPRPVRWQMARLPRGLMSGVFWRRTPARQFLFAYIKPKSKFEWVWLFLKSGVNHGLKLQTTYGKSATEKVLPAEVLQLVWMICFVSVFFFFFI